jgi:Rieske Fe-S protein
MARTSRRRFLIGGLAGAGALAVASAELLRGSVAAARTGGARRDLGPLSTVLASIPANGVLELPDLRMALVRYEPLPGREAVNAGVAVAGLLALRARCTHLGCRLPLCQSSGWFECPCHGARFNRAGEYEFGPAPRGMDRLRLSVRRDPLSNTDHLWVDHFRNAVLVQGPPRGTFTIDDDPSGPHCED